MEPDSYLETLNILLKFENSSYLNKSFTLSTTESIELAGVTSKFSSPHLGHSSK